ncbi:MAG: ribonuclease HII [Candidatus Omnitrophica bacterium]|nr:ribonuclease HII [Candidatus Omnitrophota bacterium]
MKGEPVPIVQRIEQLRRFDRTMERRYGLRFSPLAGIDEVGRGPLAGPVVAGAVVLRRFSFPVAIDDSKRLSPKAREAAFRAIVPHADVGIGVVYPEEIDRTGIHAACHAAMRLAFEKLSTRPALVLVDGPSVWKDCPVQAVPVIGGDAKSLSIACASIVAKVIRDRWMDRLHLLVPEYGFMRHKGYGTSAHLKAIRRIGPSSFHRYSFHPMRPDAFPE